MGTIEAFDSEVHDHDARVAALGLAIWVGSEPTFTDREAQSAEWLNAALGGDKQVRAQALLRGLWERFPGGLALRSVGRRYPGEDEPRWSLGLVRRRDGLPLWQGPLDPMLDPDAPRTPPDLDAWAAALSRALLAAGWAEAAEPAAQPAQADERRVALRAPAREGADCVFVLGTPALDGMPTPRVELPALADVPQFLAVLKAVEQASLACGVGALVVAGCQPPVDARLELTTVTPDPAVIEVNTAPSRDAWDFLRRSREIYAAAADRGLSPYRLYFNGTVADSGGGGQITLGGPSPQDSPFLREPRLLPRLVRFLNRHPALSYLYCHDFVGSSGQSVRADERGGDAFDELALALDLLECQTRTTPELLWHSLAPFLCDAAGNSHRAEVNIEKLWNPYLPGRGLQGLVEFRALRMQHTPERATALACLLRAVAAMLAQRPYDLPLIDWGRDLHQRYALPHYLEQDLDGVLQELQSAGLGLGDSVRSVLLRESFRCWGQADLPGCRLEVRRALEFWPLLGDAASAEQGGPSRLVDASTARIELRLRPVDAERSQAAHGAEGVAADWRDWQVLAEGIALPMRSGQDRTGALKVYGLRYRSFVPAWGLHPALGAQTPVRLLLRHPRRDADHVVTLHEWHPEGAAYDGLPGDLAEAVQRRAERVTVDVVPRDPTLVERAPLGSEAGAYGMDLRRVAGCRR